MMRVGMKLPEQTTTEIKCPLCNHDVDVSAVVPNFKKLDKDSRWPIIRELRDRGWSTTRIGQALGYADHTTVLYALRRMRQ